MLVEIRKRIIWWILSNMSIYHSVQFTVFIFALFFYSQNPIWLMVDFHWCEQIYKQIIKSCFVGMCVRARAAFQMVLLLLLLRFIVKIQEWNNICASNFKIICWRYLMMTTMVLLLLVFRLFNCVQTLLPSFSNAIEPHWKEMCFFFIFKVVFLFIFNFFFFLIYILCSPTKHVTLVVIVHHIDFTPKTKRKTEMLFTVI